MLTQILITAISSGTFAGVVTWVFTKKERNNDFIPKLQNSINTLSSNYTSTLNRMVAMENKNAELLIGQSKLERQLDIAKQETSKTKQQLSFIEGQNSSLLKRQTAMQVEIDLLRKENSNLVKKVNELNRMLKNPDVCKT